jgi:hypothetical protein
VPNLVPLGKKQVLEQLPMNFGPQWDKKPVRGFRFSLRTARPRFALPVTAPGPATLQIAVAHDRPEALDRLMLACNGVDLEARPLTPVRPIGGFWHRHFTTDLGLRPDRASLLEFRLTPGQTAPADGRGLAIGKIRLTPTLR